MSALRPVLFVDRDGTLIEEPGDFQIDAYEKLRFVPGVIPALLRLRDAGYRFVMVTNQDGLGTDAFPRERFEGPHGLMMQVLESQGVAFDDVLIDSSLPADNAPTRKPGIGLALPYLKDRSIDWMRSAMVGDRETDNAFARNLGIRPFQLRTAQFGGEWDWAGIAHALADAPRVARVVRRTRETQIEVAIDLDRAAEPRIETGLGFFDHMLEQLSKHSGVDMTIRVDGDLHIDEHHTIEDTAIALGEAFQAALGSKLGISRYGYLLPMDDVLAQVAIDFSGRPWLVWEAEFKRERVGDMPTEMFYHFFKSFSDASKCNLNVKAEGSNEHHKIEAIFKAVAKSIKMAVARDIDNMQLPTTKGLL